MGQTFSIFKLKLLWRFLGNFLLKLSGHPAVSFNWKRKCAAQGDNKSISSKNKFLPCSLTSLIISQSVPEHFKRDQSHYLLLSSPEAAFQIIALSENVLTNRSNATKKSFSQNVFHFIAAGWWVAFRLETVRPDWAIYWTLGNFFGTINLPKSLTFFGIFCKGVIFLVKSFWATFINIWRHWLEKTRFSSNKVT